VGLVTRAAPAVVNTPRASSRRPVQFSKGIESLEHQTAVVAQKLMKTNKTHYKQGIVVIALNALTVTSRALHGKPIIASFSLPR